MSSIEESVISKVRFRADNGLIKYGVTMERTDLSRLDWLIHAQEEAMDLAVYLEKLIQDFTPEKVRLTNKTIRLGQSVEVIDDVGDVKSGMIATVIGPSATNNLWCIRDSIGRVFWMNPDNLYHVTAKV